MNKRLYISVLLLLGLVACSQARSLQPTQATAPTTELPTPTPLVANSTITATVSMKLTDTPLGTVAQSEIVELVQPTKVRSCPNEQKRSLAELGVQSDPHLLVAPIGNTNNSISYSFLGTEGEMKQVSIRESKKFTQYSIFAISPDQKWFAFLADTLDGEFNQLWFSSVDGSKQWAVPVSEGFVSFDWIDREIAILSKPSLASQFWPETSARLNPFTGDTIFLTPILLENKAYVFSPDGNQVVYVATPGVWHSHDYATNASQIVFPWANTYRVVLPGDATLRRSNQGLSAAFMDEVKLDVVKGLSFDSLTNADVIKQRIEFSDKAIAWAISWLSPSEEEFIAIRRRLEGKEEFSFYILDASKWILYDYCLPQSLLPLVSYSSVDGRFIAWEGKQDDVAGTMVMEVTSGERVWIPGLRVFGWVELSE